MGFFSGGVNGILQKMIDSGVLAPISEKSSPQQSAAPIPVPQP